MKYKLIKLFPTLPKDWKIGMILNITTNTYNKIKSVRVSDKFSFFYFEVEAVENNPEFFKKINKINYNKKGKRIIFSN